MPPRHFPVCDFSPIVLSFVISRSRSKDHPLLPIRIFVNDALQALSREFDKMHSDIALPSITSEKPLRAIRSAGMLMEQLNYNLLFGWFSGLNMDDEVWDATVLTKN